MDFWEDGVSGTLNDADRVDRSIATIKEKTAALLAGRAGIWDYDPSADRLCYCMGAARAFGLPSDVRFSGLPLAHLAEVVHPDDRAIYLSRVAPTLKDGGHISVTLRTDPATGGSRRLLLRGDANLGGDGAEVHISGIVVELPDESEHLSSDDGPQHDQNSVSPGFLAAIDHILAARACLTDLGGSQRTMPLIDMLLMDLGRTLAQKLGQMESK